MSSLANVLDERTVPGSLYERLPDNAVRCVACGHRCLIREGRRGICKVRFNQGGILRVPSGYVAGLQCDPTEKKPFFHLLPGSDTLTFGMLGCDFHCGYCQNWVSSQALRDPASDISIHHIREVSPQDLVKHAKQMGARVVASSYNEPLITSEWAAAIFDEAVQAGLKCAYVSNGNATPEVLDFLEPNLEALKVDLKTMQAANYRKLGGVLQHVLDTIQMAHERGLWVEVVTLVVPDFNDSSEELMDAARFLASISLDIPWHVTAFHSDYKMTDRGRTGVDTLRRAAEIGEEAGLRYVYAGNIPGRIATYEDTRCPNCGHTVISRRGFTVIDYALTDDGECPDCSTPVAGIWPTSNAQVRRGSVSAWYDRRPRPVL